MVSMVTRCRFVRHKELLHLHVRNVIPPHHFHFVPASLQFEERLPVPGYGEETRARLEMHTPISSLCE